MNKEIETQEKAKILQIILDSFSATDPPGCAVIATEALYDAGYRNVNDMKLTSEEVTNLVWRDSPIGYKVAQAQLNADRKKD